MLTVVGLCSLFKGDDYVGSIQGKKLYMRTFTILCENFFITLGVSLIYMCSVTTVIGGKNTTTFKVNLLIFSKVCVGCC